MVTNEKYVNNATIVDISQVSENTVVDLNSTSENRTEEELNNSKIIDITLEGEIVDKKYSRRT